MLENKRRHQGVVEKIMPLIVKIIKRIVEKMTKGYFFELIKKSYENKNSVEHNTIIERGKRSYGINKVSHIDRLVSCWFIDFVFQAQRNLLMKCNLPRVDLKFNSIGISDLKIHCYTSDLNSSQVYLLGFSDNIIHFRLYGIFVSQGTVAIDVGANLGMHSLVLSEHVGNKGKVFSFEPVDTICQRFIDNVQENNVNNVILCQKGVSSKKGVTKFNFDQKNCNVGQGRIDQDGEVEIDITTLDDELSNNKIPVSLIKVDVEEHELEAIKGVKDTLTMHQPVIISEFNAKSYSFKEFKENIPYEAVYYKIPGTFYGKLEIVTDQNGENFDILVIPESKLSDEINSELNDLFL